jgi:hypothetical protein
LKSGTGIVLVRGDQRHGDAFVATEAAAGWLEHMQVAACVFAEEADPL